MTIGGRLTPKQLHIAGLRLARRKRLRDPKWVVRNFREYARDALREVGMDHRRIEAMSEPEFDRAVERAIDTIFGDAPI